MKLTMLALLVLGSVYFVHGQRSTGDTAQTTDYCFDLVFAVDRSCSMGHKESNNKTPKYRAQLESVDAIIDGIIDSFTIGPEDVKVNGFLTFDRDTVKTEISSFDKETIKGLITVARDHPTDNQYCRTHTWDAVTVGRELLPDNNNRQRVLVILTDGKPFMDKEDNEDWPNNEAYAKTEQAALISNTDGIITIVVKFPNKNHPTENFDQVFDLLTDGNKDNQITTDVISNEVIADVVNVLKKIECRGQVEKKCNLELAFTLDRSHSITHEEIREAKDFMKDIVAELTTLDQEDDDKSTLALFSYNKNVYPHLKGQECDSIDCLQNKIDENIPDTNGNFTRTDWAINKCGQYFTDPNNGLRDDVPWVCLVFTDGRSFKPSPNHPNEREFAIRNSQDTIAMAHYWKNKTPKSMNIEIVALKNYLQRNDDGEWDAVASHWVFNGEESREVAAKTISTSLCSLVHLENGP